MRLFRAIASASLLAFCFQVHAEWTIPPWKLEIDKLTMGSVTARELTAQDAADLGADSTITLQAKTVTTAESDTSYGPVSLTCDGSLQGALESSCMGGRWQLNVGSDWPVLKGILQESSVAGEELSLRTRGTISSLNWTATVSQSNGVTRAQLLVPAQGVEALSFLQSRFAQISWLSAGNLNGSAEITMAPEKPLEATARFKLDAVDFDSPDGLYAGLGVSFELAGRLDSVANLSGFVEGQISNGELLVHDFYRDFSDRALSLSSSVALDERAITLSPLRLADGDALDLTAQLRVPFDADVSNVEIALQEFELGFPQAYKRYIEPVVAVYSLDGLETSGVISWSGDWEGGWPRNGMLQLSGFSADDLKRGRFAISGVNGNVQSGASSMLTWQGATLVKLDLGSGEAHVGLTPDAIKLLQPLRVPVFGGEFALERFSVALPEVAQPGSGVASENEHQGDLDILLQASLSNIEMRQMSAALDWPEFGGTLTGSIPGVNISGGVVEIEGDLEFEIFGGKVVLTDLRVERLFGVLPSLAANISASSLDLEQLTQTFDFGQIAGSVDGYVRDLRMLDWEPVQFDAWFGTPEGGGRNDISRQAVSHLTSIGGGSPTALLSGPVLRLFNNFSYRRIGLGCVLQDNICSLRGVEQKGDAVLLLEGAGIPKISILAYNRAVDWPQFVAELAAVSAGDGVKIGD